MSMSTGSEASSQERVSVVIPLLDEEAVLPELRRRLVSTLSGPYPDFEVVFVDDGSTDGTARLIDEMHAEDPRFKCVHLSRNFGHQAAVTAGIEHARGDAVAVMDADLQDPPEVLLALLDEWKKGQQVVYAVRRQRKEHPVKVMAYDLFYRLLAHLSSVPLPLDAGDFCVMSSDVVRELRRLPEKERFVRGLRAWVGFSQVGVEYERSARAEGESKYGIIGLLRLALNGLVSLSDKPLIYVMLFGLLISAVAFLYGAYLVVRVLLFGGVITGYASLMGGLLFLSGIQLVALGVVGLYLSKVYQEVKARPTYIARSTLGFGDDQAHRVDSPLAGGRR